MNVFLKALLRGKLLTTAMLEKRMEELPGKVERYHKIEQSSELKEFEDLSNLVKSEVYLTNEQKHARLTELARSRQIKLYNKLLAKKALQDFLEWSKVEENYSKLADAAAVKADATLKQMKKIDASSDLRIWQGLEQSAEVLEYLRLQKEVVDYSKETRRQAELAKSEDILFYQKMDVRDVARYDHAKKLFEDDFNTSMIDKNGWVAGFAYPKGFKNVHSYVNEQQAYVGGKNVEVKDGILYIHTKKEAVEAPAWDEKKGMVMEHFSHTSDVIYNTQAFEEGTVIQIKARCRGFLNHGIYLRSDKHVPFISVFNYTDRACYCGLKASLKSEDYKHVIEDLQPIPFSIYTLVWGKDEIVWYLNNMEVHRTKNVLPKGEKMYLHLYSFQFKEKFMTEGALEIDWIKAYRM